MKYIKLNKNWNAEPNVPEPSINVNSEGIEIEFLLNPLLYEHIDEGEKGIIQFFHVYAYYFGPPNEKEYKNGNFRFKNHQLPWGEFYELMDSKWEKDFPTEMELLVKDLNKKSLRHFIFFLKNATLECLATDFSFEFVDTVSETLELKYPKGYLNHYLAMFTANFDKPSIENYHIYTDLYIQMEGKKEFSDLRTEIVKIQNNNDLPLYLKLINYSGIENFGMKQLTEMLKVIETYKVR